MASKVTQPERAMQIWQILIAAAYDRRTLTYQQVGQCLGIKGGGVFSQSLGCRRAFKSDQLCALNFDQGR